MEVRPHVRDRKTVFPPTGEETSYYVLVKVSRGDGDRLTAESTLAEPQAIPEGAEHPPAFVDRDGELASVLSEALAFAEPKGYPVRVIKPEDVQFPPELGTYVERQTSI